MSVVDATSSTVDASHNRVSPHQTMQNLFVGQILVPLSGSPQCPSRTQLLHLNLLSCGFLPFVPFIALFLIMSEKLRL